MSSVPLSGQGGDLRLYAVGADEMLQILGASQQYAAELTEIAARAMPTAAEPAAAKHGLLDRLGPIFRRAPQAVLVDPNDPTGEDLTRLLGGQFIPPDRVVATWRLLEILAQGRSWGSTRLSLDQRALDDFDFALARGGVSAAVGVRHLVNHDLRLTLPPAAGLKVGFQPYTHVLDMADAYRQALPQVPGEDRQELIAGLIKWLDGFPHWAEVAPRVGRPVPDLVGFWVS